ncbi:MAG: FadR family transcriptional regulator [Clostridia bacterium]|nr:FadR family transcriptional regulator [Clostridia bacterium]
MKVNPIVNKQKYESVADQIILLIKNNTFTEGSRLPTEADLAAMFQIGRSSVREAIKSLQMAGIVTSTAGKGTFVSENAMTAISSWDLGELIMDESALSELVEIRYILEPAAAFLAATRRTDADILQMKEAINNMHGVKDKSHMLRFGHQFHSALLNASKNRAIIQFHDSISQQLLKMREKDFLTQEVYDRDLTSHQEILDAIIASDSILAEQKMREHLLKDYSGYMTDPRL